MWLRDGRGWYVTLNGEQIPLGPTSDVAKRNYTALLAERLGVKSSTGITLRELAEQFRLNYEYGSEATKESYRKTIRSIHGWFSASFVAEELVPYVVHKWLDETGPDGPAGVRKRISEVVRILNWGVEQGYLKTNPIAGIKKPKLQPREHFIPPDRLREFIQAIPHQPGKDLATFMLETGCRVAEVRILTRIDYDAKNNRFVLYREDSKGKRRKRVIFLSQKAKTLIGHWLHHFPTGPLFRNTHGTPWTAQNIGKTFDAAGKKIGLNFKVCGTVLRHSYTYNRLLAGQDVATVSKLLGHSTTDMVMTVYGHMCDGPLLEKAADAVAIP
jgi:integrase